MIFPSRKTLHFRLAALDFFMILYLGYYTYLSCKTYDPYLESYNYFWPIGIVFLCLYNFYATAHLKITCTNREDNHMANFSIICNLLFVLRVLAIPVILGYAWSFVAGRTDAEKIMLTFEGAIVFCISTMANFNWLGKDITGRQWDPTAVQQEEETPINYQ